MQKNEKGKKDSSQEVGQLPESSESALMADVEAPSAEPKEDSKKPRKSKYAKEIEKLREELERQKKETCEIHDKWLRSVAELENYKKRASKEKEELARYGNERIIKELLPIIDNLERALDYSNRSDNHKALVEGVEMTRKQFISILEKFGVSRVECLNKPFNPAHHEAMMQVESRDHQPNIIIQELESGYLLNDRLIRPAKVVVSKPPEAEGQEKQEQPSKE